MISQQTTALAAAAAISLSILLYARRRRAYLEGIIEITHPDFARRACAQLHRRGYARLRLSSNIGGLARLLFEDAECFFGDAAAKRRVHVAPMERSAHNSRTGYVSEGSREYVELHPRAKPTPMSALALMRTATDFSAACHELCLSVLHVLGRSNAVLELLLDAEAAAATKAVAADSHEETSPLPSTLSSSGEPHPSSSAVSTAQTFSASMLRVHRYIDDADHPPHCDLGLLTLAPRASAPGLVIQDTHTHAWLAIEEQMSSDEAILFGGSTLSELGGPAPLPHKVVRQGAIRFSAPYFCRATPHVPLPAAALAKPANSSATNTTTDAATNDAAASSDANLVTASAAHSASPLGGAAPLRGGSSQTTDGSVGALVARICSERQREMMELRLHTQTSVPATPAWAAPMTPRRG